MSATTTTFAQEQEARKTEAHTRLTSRLPKDWEIIQCRKTGSNSSPPPFPAPTDPEERERLLNTLSDTSGFFFSTGTQCLGMSRRLDAIKREHNIPSAVGWDALVALVGSGWWDANSKTLLSSWAYLMACPTDALEQVRANAFVNRAW